MLNVLPRMKLIQALSLVLALASAALADVEFMNPAAGATAKGGDTITVQWRDSGKDPKLSKLSRYDLFLCAGGNTEDSYVKIHPFPRAHAQCGGQTSKGLFSDFPVYIGRIGARHKGRGL